MSFAREIKDELAKIKENEKKAELAAFLHMNTEVIINNNGAHLTFQTMNNSVARKFISLIKEDYDVQIDLMTKKQNLTKDDIYYIVANNAKKVIEDHHMMDFNITNIEEELSDDEKKKAYLRGAFLVNGSVNNPVNSYHLEIKVKSDKDAVLIQGLMNNFDLNAKITRRRQELIVYLKEAQKILDFIYIIGASRMYFKYEEVRVNRDISNQINRKVNCEIANEEKTILAANQQLKDIEILEKRFDYAKLDEKLVEIMELRKKNPVASFQELRDLYEQEYGKVITKSGLNHRFRRIRQMAIDD